MSPQRSNRSNLLEGTLRCLESLPAERITARAIAAESGANIASIGYHFGGKDNLVTMAVIEGLDRWLDDIARSIGELADASGPARFRQASEALDASMNRHTGLARNFIGAIAKAQHDEQISEALAAGFARTRPAIALLLGLGDDQAAEDAAGLVHAMFVGLLCAALIDPGLAIEGERLQRAQARLRELLPE